MNPLSKRLSRRRLLVFVLGLLVIGSLVFGIVYAISLYKRNACYRYLRCVSYMIMDYSWDRGQFPSDLVALLNESGVPEDTWLLMCPAVHHSKKDVLDGTDWVDYTYINWSNYYDDSRDVPADFPVVYDRALSNHGGRGINIGRVDSSVFWDSGATWLRNFAASHPEYDIPIPK